MCVVSQGSIYFSREESLFCHRREAWAFALNKGLYGGKKRKKSAALKVQAFKQTLSNIVITKNQTLNQSL